jgi:hypothetical protein
VISKFNHYSATCDVALQYTALRWKLFHVTKQVNFILRHNLATTVIQWYRIKMKSDVIVTHGHEQIIDRCGCLLELLPHVSFVMSQVEVCSFENVHLSVWCHSEIVTNLSLYQRHLIAQTTWRFLHEVQFEARATINNMFFVFQCHSNKPCIDTICYTEAIFIQN